MGKPAAVTNPEMPLWPELRLAYGFADPEEASLLATLKARDQGRQAADCPGGCQCSNITGGCRPGTSCLFSGLQSGPLH